MVWVRSEYAAELAVVFAWLSALLPWNLSYATFAGLGSVLFVRFPFVQVRYAYGIPVGDAVSVSTPLDALAVQQGQTVAVAYAVWVGGAVAVGAALLLSVALYLDEDRVDSGLEAALGVGSVRVVGGLLALAGAVLTAATYLLWTRGFPGVQIPVGVVLLYLFGVTLLVVERD